MEDLNFSQPENSHSEGKDDSLLGKVLSETELQEKTAAKPFRIVSNILASLRSRERDVLVARYGLASDKAAKETLESIGQRFSITRERVRQIENAALKKIGKKYTTPLRPILKLIASYFLVNGGVAELDGLADYLNLGEDLAETELDRRALRLILGAYDKVVPLKKHPLFKEGWALTTVSQDELVKIQEAIHKTLETIGHSVNEIELMTEVVKTISNVDQALVKGALRVDAKVSLDHKGQWGLALWPMVVPRRIRDKIFLVLEAAGKPLHFEKIAQLISAEYPSEKPVLSRTVHNELIGDSRFVLVGRGIYALEAWGYKSGVVADVIKEVMQKAGQPMQVTEIVNEVMKSRQVKKNTIVANLQNRQLFRKVAKSTYTLVVEPQEGVPR